MKDSNPVFVIGSYRSGTSVLTWCLGQHSNILPLEETNWLYKFSLSLKEIYEYGVKNGKHSHLNSVSEELDGLYRSFGNLINQYITDRKLPTIEHAERLIREYHLDPQNYSLMRSNPDSKNRWVDGTPENTHYVYGLNKLFPEAKFIHILRHPVKVANSLMKFSKMGQRDYSEEDAYRTWARLTNAAFQAEKALGAEKVLRVNQEDLERNPRSVIENCLTFIGEPFEDHCLLPLNSRINSSGTHGSTTELNADQIGRLHINNALDLYHQMMSHSPGTPDSNVYSQLEDQFNKTSEYTSAENVENLAQWGSQISSELERKSVELMELRRKIQQKYERLQIVEFGPTEITQGQGFNVQPDGQSAIWARIQNATGSTILVLNEHELETAVHMADNLLTAVVPDSLYQEQGSIPLYIKDTYTGIISEPVLVTIRGDHS